MSKTAIQALLEKHGFWLSVEGTTWTIFRHHVLVCAGDKVSTIAFLRKLGAVVGDEPCACPDVFNCPHQEPMRFSPTELASAENKRKIKPASSFTGPVKTKVTR